MAPPTTDPAFVGAGEEPGLEIYRIVNFEVTAWDKRKYGEFFSGDAYIILKTGKTRSGSYSWDLHFWLGKDSSQDEQGTAAIKSVELDDALGGQATQWREVQNHESSQFISYFKKGIIYLEGGAESGFTKVDKDAYTKRLLKVKGHRNVRCHEVERKCSSLNMGDVFILDCLRNIFVWIPPQSSKPEKLKGMEMARRIRDDLQQGEAHVHVVEDDFDTNNRFFAELGEKDLDAIQSADAGGDDRQYEVTTAEMVKLYEVSETRSGQVEVNIVEDRPLVKDLLRSKDSYILDVGGTGLYVWVGKHCSDLERKHSMQSALKFIEVFEYPMWIPVVRVVEGGEPPVFKQFFREWPEEGTSYENIAPTSPVSHVGGVAHVEQTTFDASTLHDPSKQTDSQWCPDNGSGDVKIWVVKEDLELGEYPEHAYGMFFGGDCYVMLYTYNDERGKENYIVYFWQGLQSSQDERGASAAHAVIIDTRDTHGAAVQVRLVQGKEPEHFLRMFKGKLVVFMGGHADHHEEHSKGGDATRLFHVRGTNEFNTRAVEVDPVATNLNSSDAFIAHEGKDVYLWQGKAASAIEKKWTRNVIDRLLPTKHLILVDEGEEPRGFWNALGGEQPYAFSKLVSKHPILPARLFHCSMATGNFQVEEIMNFTQEDLNTSDVMMLDTYYEIGLWMGDEASEDEKKQSLELVGRYVDTDPSSRKADDTVIVTVKQGFEPPSFTGHFHPWNSDLWSEGKSFLELKEEFGKENLGIKFVEEELKVYNMSEHRYEDLVRNPPPLGVDATKKESYLSDNEFKEIMQMTKEEFYKKPEWKRIDMKKKAGLF